MEQCVMTHGTMRMPLWCADNWDPLLMVIICQSITCDGFFQKSTQSKSDQLGVVH